MLKTESSPTYVPNVNRYNHMPYAYCGNSGLLLPQLSLGLWQNFGDTDCFDTARSIIHRAFDLGITHFDLANNYGTPYGSAESNFGRILKHDLKAYRDELIISSKAGYDMWPGPYGIGGSRKYLISSCEQSLKRMGLDYVDIFYHHCVDENTPLSETVSALESIITQGKALYVGISNYPEHKTQSVILALKEARIPLLVHQPKYNIFDRSIESGLTETLLKEKVGAIVYSPLAQGLLTDKYLKVIPKDSRALKKTALYLNEDDITESTRNKIARLNDIAIERGQSLAQMSIAWTLHNPAITSCLIGASKVSQVEDSFLALNNSHFTDEEINTINQISAK